MFLNSASIFFSHTSCLYVLYIDLEVAVFSWQLTNCPAADKWGNTSTSADNNLVSYPWLSCWELWENAGIR